MNSFEALNIKKADAICYSGFREGQHPGGICPSYAEIKSDLILLQNQWKYLRLYDVDLHAETVLEVIRNEGLNFKVMLGVFISAESNNSQCPWNAGIYDESTLKLNANNNFLKIERLVSLCKEYDNIIFSVSVGNEACVDWTDHYVPEEKVLEYVRYAKRYTQKPVTYCDNYVPWLSKLKPLSEEVDFISIHIYPIWEYKHIDEALQYSKQNYYSVAKLYPDIPVIITEAGWATKANGRGIDPDNANERFQEIYYHQIKQWTDDEGILCFLFEAFDESWKGSDDPLDPEKHWGLFNINRKPKAVLKNLETII